MGRLIYLTLMSLDGYIEDRDGKFGWAEPSQDVHAFVNDLAGAAGTYLYGRRMYETMMAWETDPTLAAQPGVAADFAQIWQAADKVVYSTTISAATTKRTRIERAFNREAVRTMKAGADLDLMIGGANLAGEALRLGLIDECHLFVVPVVVGGGKSALPTSMRIDLDLLDERRFANGTLYMRYAVRAAP